MQPPEVSIIGMDDEMPAGRVVVVLDVIRAFTTAAIAFERGATEIVCTACSCGPCPPEPSPARRGRARGQGFRVSQTGRSGSSLCTMMSACSAGRTVAK